MARSRSCHRTLALRRGQQRLDLRLRQGLGHAQRLARVGQAQGRVGLQAPFAQRPAVVALEAGQAPVGAAGLAAGVAGCGVGQQVALARRVQPTALRGEKGGQRAQVARVGGAGVGAQALLEPQRAVEGRQRGGRLNGSRLSQA
jgi:hypothetical protein